MTTLLHAHAGEHSDTWSRVLYEVILEGLLETLKILPFLFLTYLFMELIEHRASDKTKRFMERSGTAGPLVGGMLGLLPQCGFSASASSFYTARVITLGTLIAVFLSTSDEMLPIMISSSISAKGILLILLYKAVAAIFVGFAVDLILRLMRKERKPINIDEICSNDECHCERGILYSALHHTLTVGSFILLVTLILNTLYLFVGGEAIASVLYDRPVISHVLAAVFGLIPNCAVSVLFTELYIGGAITVGTMLSGLFSGAGIGLLVLFRVNKNIKENILIISILTVSATAFGLVADLLNFSAIIQ